MASPFRALIIDDDPDLLSLIRRTLEFTAGWEVQTALSGAAGIALARAAPSDVILVDLMIPDGRLRGVPPAQGRLPPVPVVLLTPRDLMRVVGYRCGGRSVRR
jgi:DNA-binding response OmpR family regulator